MQSSGQVEASWTFSGDHHFFPPWIKGEVAWKASLSKYNMAGMLTTATGIHRRTSRKNFDSSADVGSRARELTVPREMRKYKVSLLFASKELNHLQSTSELVLFIPSGPFHSKAHPRLCSALEAATELWFDIYGFH